MIRDGNESINLALGNQPHWCWFSNFLKQDDDGKCFAMAVCNTCNSNAVRVLHDLSTIYSTICIAKQTIHIPNTILRPNHQNIVLLLFNMWTWGRYQNIFCAFDFTITVKLVQLAFKNFQVIELLEYFPFFTRIGLREPYSGVHRLWDGRKDIKQFYPYITCVQHIIQLSLIWDSNYKKLIYNNKFIWCK